MNLDDYTEEELRQLRADIDARLPTRRGRPPLPPKYGPPAPDRRRRDTRQRDAEWAELLLNGHSANEIALLYGISRQVVDDRTPSWLRGLLKQRRDARRRARARAKLNRYTCRTCGVATESSARRRYCCTEHYAIYLSLRTHLPGHDDRHRVAIARGVLSHPEWDHRPGYEAWAEAMLSDVPPPKNRHYFAAGSHAERAARKAYRNGWPIFNELPEQLRKSIIDSTPTPRRKLP